VGFDMDMGQVYFRRQNFAAVRIAGVTGYLWIFDAHWGLEGGVFVCCSGTVLFFSLPSEVFYQNVHLSIPIHCHIIYIYLYP